MYKEKQIIYIKALTPVHAGTGDGLETVDMPIQREKHSNIPKIEASTLKGSIKHMLYAKFKGNKENIKELYKIFGPEDEAANYASAIGFTDAKLLLFPIKSATDIFKLITCPYIIKRWVEDLEIKYGKVYEENSIKKLEISEGECVTNENNKIVLEEYVFDRRAEINKDIEDLFGKINGIDVKRVVILNDSDFIDLVTMYTEIITRNRIDVQTGAAADTGLFTEEYLPAETVMYFLTLSAPSFDKDNSKSPEDIENYFNENVDEVFQVGGNATIGKGFVKNLSKEVK